MLGVIAAVLSRLDEAQAHLQRAIHLEPSNPYYHLHYGILLKHEGDNRGALTEMKTAEEMNPSYALTHFELGTVYEKLGDYGQATMQLEAALKLNPGLSRLITILVLFTLIWDDPKSLRWLTKNSGRRRSILSSPILIQPLLQFPKRSSNLLQRAPVYPRGTKPKFH